MTIALQARKLANYIVDLDDFTIHNINPFISYNHMGALFADMILQAGLNYNTVVKPRVDRILTKYPDENTVTKFNQLVDLESIEKVILWNHAVKIDRIYELLRFSTINRIETCADFREFLAFDSNRQKLLNIKGVGPKTIDYCLKLLNCDTVAVDRHIISFVRMADINLSGYQEIKKVVEYAADFLGVSRASIDKSIWEYMAYGVKNLVSGDRQLQIF